MTLKRRLTIALVVLASVLLGVTTLSTLLIRNTLYRQLESPLRRQPFTSEPGSLPAAAALGLSGPALGQLATTEAACRFSSLDGNTALILASSNGVRRPPCSDEPQIRVDLTKLGLEIGSSSPIFDARDERGRAYRARVTRGDGGIYLGIGISLTSTERAIRAIVAIQLVAIAVALAALWAAGSWFGRHGIRSLSRIAETARAITGGDRSQRLVVDDREPVEVQNVATALNDMLNTTDDAYTSVADALDQRQQSEARLRQFVSDVSHELRTPLTSMQGYGELLEKGVMRDHEAVADTGRRVHEEASRMGRLVKDMLRLAHLDAEPHLRKTTLDLGELVQTAVADARAADSRWPITVRDPTPGSDLVVSADRDAVHQLLTNLLANVRQHTPPGTTTNVSVNPTPTNVTITVDDNGPGIPHDVLPSVFERFVRADASRSRRTGGAGLGLSISHALVTAHGGAITAANATSGGATFCVTLPR
jgi:two-component system, OmpR family, sensor kinase